MLSTNQFNGCPMKTDTLISHIMKMESRFDLNAVVLAAKMVRGYGCAAYPDEMTARVAYASGAVHAPDS